MSVPESFTLYFRLKADSNRSPNCESTDSAMAVDDETRLFQSAGNPGDCETADDRPDEAA